MTGKRIALLVLGTLLILSQILGMEDVDGVGLGGALVALAGALLGAGFAGILARRGALRAYWWAILGLGLLGAVVLYALLILVERGIGYLIFPGLAFGIAMGLFYGTGLALIVRGGRPRMG